jgi:hypothetical protein
MKRCGGATGVVGMVHVCHVVGVVMSQSGSAEKGGDPTGLFITVSCHAHDGQHQPREPPNAQHRHHLVKSRSRRPIHIVVQY